MWRTFASPSMGTRIEVVVQDSVRAPEAAEVVFDTFVEVDARMSEWKDSSPLSAVNRQSGQPVAVPEDLRAVVRRGLEIGELTQGAFDISWAPLWGVWDFRDTASPRVPTEAELAPRVALIDYRKVVVDDVEGTVQLQQPGMKLGLGGIAKGHALDLSASRLRARGTVHFLISSGGQVYAAGLRDGRPWRVGIRDPRGPVTDEFAVVEVSDLSVSTSGDYESFFEVNGERYHHILDPRTGRPARGLRSATVITADATLADALSTACVVMGRERALAMIEARDGVEAVLVDEAGEVFTSSGLRDRLELVHAPR